MMNAQLLLALAAALAAMPTTHANAQDAATPATPATSGTPAAQPADAAATDTPALQVPELEPFHFSFAPYIWLTSISGDISVRKITIDADVDFADIVDASDSVFGLMGAIDIEYKGFVAQFNAAWSTVDFSGSRAFANNGTLSADIDMDTAWIECFGGYRFLDRSMEKDNESRRRFTVDGFAGARFTSIDVEASLKAEVDLTLPDGEMIMAGRSAERDQSETWIEPFVGARMGIDLSEHWSLNIRGDIGGFGVSGADFAWQAAALVGYRWDLEGWNIGLFGGYRALSQDYSNDDFGWDAITHGPLLGVHFGWAF